MAQVGGDGRGGGLAVYPRPEPRDASATGYTSDGLLAPASDAILEYAPTVADGLWLSITNAFPGLDGVGLNPALVTTVAVAHSAPHSALPTPRTFH